MIYKVVTLNYLFCHDLSSTMENKADRPKDSSRAPCNDIHAHDTWFVLVPTMSIRFPFSNTSMK